MAVRPLTKHLTECAINNLNENLNKLKEELEHINQWLDKQPHINAYRDDQWITAFLRGYKHSLETTKSKLDTHYSIKSAWPEVFTNRDIQLPDLQEILENGVMFKLPKPDQEGRRVLFMRPGAFDAYKIKMENVVKLAAMATELDFMEDDDLVVNGVVQVLDLSNVTANHLFIMTPTIVKRMIVCFEDGYPTRPKGVHFINTPPGFESVFNVIKSFMNEKLKSRLNVHTNIKSFQAYVPKSILPAEYGGDGPSIQEITREWNKRMESHREWFIETEKFKVDEKKRVGSAKALADFTGMVGSFRKLDVD